MILTVPRQAIFVFFGISLTLIIAFFSTDFVEHPRRSSQPPSADQAFGVGFDLNPSYAAVSINFANGTTLDVGRALGSSNYVETMQKLSLESSRRPSPPYDKKDGMTGDFPGQLLRKARKALGLPASYEVGALADLVRELLPQAEDAVGGRIESAAFTMPHFPAIYEEDISDLCEYLGIQNLPLPSLRMGNQDHLIYHTTAALAANGIGLCQHFSDEARCNDELNHSNATGVSYAVGYYKNALTMSSARFKGATGLWADTAWIDFDLGAVLAKQGARYWDAVDVMLDSIDARYLVGMGPLQVQLFGEGESVRDTQIKENIRSLLAKKVGFDSEVHSAHPDFACARGAALLARQFASRLETPAGPGPRAMEQIL